MSNSIISCQNLTRFMCVQKVRNEDGGIKILISLELEKGVVRIKYSRC